MRAAVADSGEMKDSPLLGVVEKAEAAANTALPL